MADSWHGTPFRHHDAVKFHRTRGENRASSMQSEKSWKSHGIQRPQANQQQFDFGLELPDGSNYNAVDSVLPDSDHSARGLRSWHRRTSER
ncbi:hypothetical protein K0M31_017146 [Melipona bicolor]|uniref:Uncharacterized protein n=1 Tax=Melipona bicolor TaxID=60889 RepID=A0AA40FDD3_9HYME|nr:hypothetical protein K0M31_017146 [Melipona bicolor]